MGCTRTKVRQRRELRQGQPTESEGSVAMSDIEGCFKDESKLHQLMEIDGAIPPHHDPFVWGAGRRTNMAFSSPWNQPTKASARVMYLTTVTLERRRHARGFSRGSPRQPLWFPTVQRRWACGDSPAHRRLSNSGASRRPLFPRLVHRQFDGRKLQVSTSFRDPRGTEVGSASALFIMVDVKHLPGRSLNEPQECAGRDFEWS